jgi:hypothetical protein
MSHFEGEMQNSSIVQEALAQILWLHPDEFKGCLPMVGEIVTELTQEGRRELTAKN